MCTIHDCYLDDSKDKKQEFAYVCAGFFGAERAWAEFTEKWREQLRREGISYFKASECNTLSGEFRRFKTLPDLVGREGADQIRERLENVATESAELHAVGTALPVSEFKAVLQHANAEKVFPGNYIYHRCFEETLLLATRAACASNERDLMMFTHDDGPDFGELNALFRDFRKKNPTAGKRLTNFFPGDDTKVPALQVADMLANSLQRTTVKILTGEGAGSRKRFPGINIWTREHGEKVLLHNMKKRNIPVPASLERAISLHDEAATFRSRQKFAIDTSE